MRILGACILAAVSVLGWPMLAAAQAQTAPVGASAQLNDPTGKLMATATLRELPDEVLINLSFPDRAVLTGTHGIQIHEVGRCDAPTFSTAGAIFNPFGKQHGLLNPAGPMVGDLPSLVIGPDGLAVYNTSAPLAKLTTGPSALLRQGGTSLIIYSAVDDDKTQPEGNSGTRIACGVIVAGTAAAGGAITSVISPTASNPLTAGVGGVPASTVIAVLGLLLIGAGVFLRQRRVGQPRG